MNNLADSLTTIKAHLRQKYLNEIDVIHRSTAEDPEAWDKLDQVSTQIQHLSKLLKDTDDLILPSTTTEENDASSSSLRALRDELCCPICFEEMVSPKKILCCRNGHPICSDCDGQVQLCPVCRVNLKELPGRRNQLAERLISAFLHLMK